MKRTSYLALEQRQDFEPIKVKLDNTEEIKDFDFKLVVLLILILMLGILINEEQQRLDLQIERPIDGNNIEQNSLLMEIQLSQRTREDKQQKNQPIQEQLLMNKQQYSFLKKQTNYKNGGKSLQFYTIDPSLEQSENEMQKTLYPSTEQQHHDNLKTSKYPRKNKQQQSPLINQKSSKHSKLLKKYIEFYLWFPFFIFALIIYSCYQKHSDHSILISVKTLDNIDSIGQVTECAICINEILSTDPLVVLPCSKKHAFHSRCIKQWLPEKKTCPICRSDVRKFRRTQN